MPNWVKNELNFDSTEDLLNAMKKLKPDWKADDGFSFEWVVPIPKTKEECPAEYVIPEGEDRHLQTEKGMEWFDWYKWQCDNWGTKWDACNVDVCDNKIYFDTAWSPATPIFIALADKLFDFSFTILWSEEQGPLYNGIFGHDRQESDDELSYWEDDFEEYSDEAYQTYNNLWGEYFEKTPEDNSWHSEDDEGAFRIDGELHFYDLGEKDPEIAKELYKQFGNEFLEFLLEYDDSQEFIRSLLGEEIVGKEEN